MSENTSESVNNDELMNAISEDDVKAVLEKYGFDEIKRRFAERIDEIDNNREQIQVELDELRKTLSRKEQQITKRIEKMMNLMSTHMVFLRQMIGLLDNFGLRLDEYDKSSERYKSEHTIIVDRMNQMVRCFKHLEKNMQDIVDTVDDLRSQVDGFDRLKFKLIAATTIGIVVIVWLLKGGDLSRVILFFQGIFSGAK